MRRGGKISCMSRMPVLYMSKRSGFSSCHRMGDSSAATGAGGALQPISAHRVVVSRLPALWLPVDKVSPIAIALMPMTLVSFIVSSHRASRRAYLTVEVLMMYCWGGA